MREQGSGVHHVGAAFDPPSWAVPFDYVYHLAASHDPDHPGEPATVAEPVSGVLSLDRTSDRGCRWTGNSPYCLHLARPR